MSQKTPAIAVRLIGFTSKEEETFASVFAVDRDRDYSYLVLRQGSLQDPEMYIVNAEDLKALTILSDLNPGDAQPALLIGKTGISLPHPILPRPIRWRRLLEMLDALADRRRMLLTTLSALDTVTVPERRLRERVDLDLSDPAHYEKMRKQASAQGGILIVDKDFRFKDYVASLTENYRFPVNLATDHISALESNAQHKHALMMVNTSTPDINPYHLCEMIKGQHVGHKVAAVLLIDRSFAYDKDAAKGRCEGFLDKPLARKVIIAAMQKFLPMT
ncbi:response regulator [Undibacterium sp.]|uniref:response regulator n=1 Tax=Undibacterium sp. TaxID=1914977 RepID=UPI00374CE2CF